MLVIMWALFFFFCEMDIVQIQENKIYCIISINVDFTTSIDKVLVIGGCNS